MDTETQPNEQFNVTFVLGTAVIGVGVIMPEGTILKLQDEEDGLADSMVQAAAEELMKTYSFNVSAHDLKDVTIENISPLV